MFTSVRVIEDKSLSSRILENNFEVLGLGLGLGSRVLGLGLEGRVLGIGLGLEACVLDSITDVYRNTLTYLHVLTHYIYSIGLQLKLL